MNAREAMKLLLEGRTLERDDPWYLMKLDENGTLVSCDSKNLLHGPHGFSNCHTMIGELDRVYEEREHKPCPFCGSAKIVELSFDDEGNELNEWMMADANRESESEGLPGFESWDEFVKVNAYIYQIQCADCNAGVISKKSIGDALDKWNKRVDPKE